MMVAAIVAKVEIEIMPDTPQTEGNPQNSQPNNKNLPRSYVRRIVVYSFIAFAILLGLSIWWPNLAERTKFFTNSGLLLALLIVAIAQVLIYHRQQEIMRGQLDVMKAGIRQTKRFFDLTERPSLGMEGEMEFSQEPTGEAFIQVTIKNSGKSPAVRVLSGISTGIEIPNIHNPMGHCPEPAKGEMLGIESRGVIAIGGTTFLSSKTLTAEEFMQVIEGDLKFVIWVYVSYCKNAGQRKPYIFESYSSYKAETGEFVVCPTHNNAT